ncbi:MAG: LysR substrate-binding domain-containing protein [bacterium]
MRYTLRQLQVFLAAANHENISRASLDLHLSQSAASSALKELESHIGVQLFDRAGKRLKLNDQGRLLRPKVEELLARAEELEDELVLHTKAGPITVGATMTIGNYLAVDIMSRYLAEDPAARVTLQVANTKTIAEKVKNFDIDIGLIEGELYDPELDVDVWMEDELVPFCSPQHPLAKKRRLTDADILRESWIVREQGSGTRQAFDRAMHGLLPDLHITELEHTEAIKRAVSANLGISALSRFTLEEEFESRRLVPLKLSGRDLTRNFYFVLNKNKYRTAGIQRWLAFCHDTRLAIAP